MPATPHHVIQRGHNRQVVFATDEDFQCYLDTLWEWKAKLGCRIYAYPATMDSIGFTTLIRTSGPYRYTSFRFPTRMTRTSNTLS